MTRQGKILLVCLVGLLLALGYSYFRAPEQQRVVRTEEETAKGRVKPTKASTPREGKSGEDSLPRLRLEPDPGREDRGGEYVQTGKDLFAPLYSGGVKTPPPPAPAEISPAVMGTEPEENPADLMPAVSAVPAFESAAQPARFEVLGYLEIENRRVVFLETGGEVFLARRGESFGDDFRVVEMNDERLVVSQRGVPRTITLELEGEQGVTGFGSAAPFSDKGRNVVPETRRFR
jgi:hypothetical protein